MHCVEDLFPPSLSLSLSLSRFLQYDTITSMSHRTCYIVIQKIIYAVLYIYLQCNTNIRCMEARSCKTADSDKKIHICLVWYGEFRNLEIFNFRRHALFIQKESYQVIHARLCVLNLNSDRVEKQNFNDFALSVRPQLCQLGSHFIFRESFILKHQTISNAPSQSTAQTSKISFSNMTLI